MEIWKDLIYLQNIFRKNLKKCQITTFKLFTGIKEALIMRISATNMHNLAVKRHKIVKVLLPIVPSAKLSPREILKNFTDELNREI